MPVSFLQSNYFQEFLLHMRKAININNYFNPRQNEIKIKPFELEFNRKKDRNANDSQQYKQEEPVAPLSHTKTQQFTPLRKKMTADSDYENKRSDFPTERNRDISPKRANQKQSADSTYRPYYQLSTSPMKSRSSNMKSDRQLSYELEANINKLKDIKIFLQQEINSLQSMLDDTSRSIQKIDKQYFVIKQKILSYTARSLDTAFKNYKKKMTRWTKYQDIEKKSIDVLKQLKQYIAEGESKLKNQDQRSEITERMVKEIADRVEHYKLTSNQIKKVRQQCFSKHPIIQQDKIIDFEKAVQEICCF